jgi:hypothetical protein
MLIILYRFARIVLGIHFGVSAFVMGCGWWVVGDS